jgi:hypothetical protein
MDTLDAAIGVAQGVYDKAGAAQGEVDTAAGTLNSAIAAFNNAKQDGTQPAGSEGGEGNITITVPDGKVVVTPSDNIVLSKTNSNSHPSEITLTGPAGFASGDYLWYIDADPPKSGQTLTLKASDYRIKTYSLTLVVGVYSAILEFTVTQ